MKIAVQLYDDCGCACGCFYKDINTLQELLEYLDEVSPNREFIYEIRKVKENE